jgi:cytoskeletal protein RodZ
VVDVRPETDDPGLPDVLSPVLHPVGPKPAGTYWLRRILVLVVIVAIVVVAVQLLRGGSEPDPGQTRTAALPTTSASPSSTASATPTASTQPSAATPSASAEATPAPTTAQCAPTDLAVTVGTDGTSYGADGDPTVTLTVTNNSAQACETNVGQNALEVKVGSGDTAVWSSDVCYPGGESDVRTLEPGAVYTTSVVWRRVASADGCPAEPRVEPGTYSVQGRAGDVLSEPVEIVLG